MKCKTLVAAVLVTVALAASSGQDAPRVSRADWMRGSFGVSVHWVCGLPCADGTTIPFEDAVNGFDVKAFADSLAEVGARHLVFTTAHGRQVMAMPNAALDAIEPGRTTKRDLFGEILDACQRRDIRVIAYYNHSCNGDADHVTAWKKACGCPFVKGGGGDMRAFASNVCAIVRCMSRRYGRKISGWWFDSSYSVDSRGTFTLVDGVWHTPKNPYKGPVVAFPWDDLLAAARSGNPDAAVAINAGVDKVCQLSENVDYYAGEAESFDAELDGPIPPNLVDTRWITLDDKMWTFSAQRGYLPIRKPVSYLREWTNRHNAAGRMVTFNVLIDARGRLTPEFAKLKEVFPVGNGRGVE